MTLQLTEPRRRGLAVLTHGERAGRPVFESNVTTPLDQLDGDRRLTIYWQTRGWMQRHGLIRPAVGASGWVLTDAGRRVAAEAVAV